MPDATEQNADAMKLPNRPGATGSISEILFIQAAANVMPYRYLNTEMLRAFCAEIGVEILDKPRPTVHPEDGFGVKALRDLHKPYGIYDECGHDHEPDEPGVVYCDEIGYSCTKLFDICAECCFDGDGQSEWCAMHHDHGPGKPICKTARLLATIQAKTPEIDDAMAIRFLDRFWGLMDYTPSPKEIADTRAALEAALNG